MPRFYDIPEEVQAAMPSALEAAKQWARWRANALIQMGEDPLDLPVGTPGILSRQGFHTVATEAGPEMARALHRLPLKIAVVKSPKAPPGLGGRTLVNPKTFPDLAKASREWSGGHSGVGANRWEVRSPADTGMVLFGNRRTSTAAHEGFHNFELVKHQDFVHPTYTFPSGKTRDAGDFLEASRWPPLARIGLNLQEVANRMYNKLLLRTPGKELKGLVADKSDYASKPGHAMIEWRARNYMLKHGPNAPK